MCACLSVCEPCAHRIQKRVFEPLGLELQAIVTHHMGVGNQSSPQINLFNECEICCGVIGGVCVWKQVH